VPDKKIITDSAIIGQLGVNFVERILLKMGFVLHTTNSLEAGIDGFVELRDSQTGAASNFIIAVQVKATEQRFPKETSNSFEWPCNQRDLDYWLQGNAPIVLIVARPQQDEAYWMPLKPYFSDLATRARRRIVFDKASNRFDEICASEFTSQAVPIHVGIYGPPIAKREKLYINLLAVTTPRYLFVGHTEYGDYRELHAAMRRDQRRADLEWIIRRKTLISLHDISEGPFKHYCDQGTVERHETRAWEGSEDCRNELRQLFGLALKQKMRGYPVLFDPKREYFYFASTAGGRPRRLEYRGLRSDTEREVCGPRRSKIDGTRVLYFRHSAMQWAFHYIGGRWFLEITPTYHFTRDGSVPDRFASERMKKIKEKEKNAAVLGQVVMWADLLSRPGDLFTDEYPLLQFGRPEILDIENGIDDDKWLAREDKEERESAQKEFDFLK
jgi:Domain of unknown function (DUF4365)